VSMKELAVFTVLFQLMNVLGWQPHQPQHGDYG
jgi:hypothetical protein